MSKPIFYDSSGKRNRYTLRFTAILLLAIALGALAFAWTVVSLPAGAPLKPTTERDMDRPLSERLNRFGHRAGWLPKGRISGHSGKPISTAFYVTWDRQSLGSLQRNINQIDWVIPSLATVTDAGQKRVYTPDLPFRGVISAAVHRPQVLPMIQNSASDAAWDGEGLGKALAKPATRAALIDWAAQIVTEEHGTGIVFDFEQLPPSALANYRLFLTEARAKFAPRGWLVTLAVPLDDPAWDMRAFAAAADRLFLMNYDQHASWDDPGPVAAQPWFAANLSRVLGQIPPGKAIVAIGGYCYDFTSQAASDVTVGDAWAIARDANAKVLFDPVSGNSTFAYADDANVKHVVWMLDAGCCQRMEPVKCDKGIRRGRLCSVAAGQ